MTAETTTSCKPQFIHQTLILGKQVSSKLPWKQGNQFLVRKVPEGQEACYSDMMQSSTLPLCSVLNLTTLKIRYESDHESFLERAEKDQMLEKDHVRRILSRAIWNNPEFRMMILISNRRGILQLLRCLHQSWTSGPL